MFLRIRVKFSDAPASSSSILPYVSDSSISVNLVFSASLSSRPCETKSSPFRVKSAPGIGTVENFDRIKPSSSFDHASVN